MNELVQITQSSVIDYSALYDVSASVKKRIADLHLEVLVITEDNIKEIKKQRAELTKEFGDYEKDRIRIKDEVMKPYADFEKIYKSEITDTFKGADSSLKTAVDEIENGIKQEKIDELKSYFAELVALHNIDFLIYEQVGVKVGLNDTLKSLRASVLKFVEEIADGISLINTLENRDRILVRFKSNLNASRSIIEINREVEQENQAKIQREQVKAAEPTFSTAYSTVQPTTPFMAETVLKAPTKVAPEELITLTLKITGTKPQLISVREFLKKEGINYE